jgi:hypothetical protein
MKKASLTSCEQPMNVLIIAVSLITYSIVVVRQACLEFLVILIIK